MKTAYLSVPPAPDVPDEQQTRGDVELVFEELSQDHRVLFTALPKTLGTLLWRNTVASQPSTRAIYQQGIVPILSRVSMSLGGGPVSVHQRFHGDARYALFHTTTDQGQVDRLMLNMWVSLSGQRSQTYAPAPPASAPRLTVGTMCAEHVFTRPFGPAAQRKVVRFDIDGVPPVPPERWEWQAPLALLQLPDGATPLDATLLPDAAPIVMALHHTDPNQHVNSLVYMRLFQDAAIRRFHDHRRDVRLMATQIDICYRKPMFVGEVMGIELQAFEWNGALCALGQFVTLPRAAEQRPHATVAMRFG